MTGEFLEHCLKCQPEPKWPKTVAKKNYAWAEVSWLPTLSSWTGRGGNAKSQELRAKSCVMRRLVRNTAAVLVLASALVRAGEAAVDQAPSERVLAEARRILANAKTSQYSHKTKVDEENGSYALDCSGLAVLILKRVAPEQLASLPKNGKSRPRAVEFHTAFAAAPTGERGAKGWRRIEKLMDARPGDFIVWRKEEIKPGDSTGHVVLVDQAPVEDEGGRARVVVVDSTGNSHADDSRSDGENGVGRGTMWFDVDAAGRPVAYRWKSRNGPSHKTPIAIGRVTTYGTADVHR